MSRNWDTENGVQAAAFPRVGLLSLPEEPLGETGHGVATISLPYGVLLVLVDGTARSPETRGNTERSAVQAIRRVMQNARLNPEDVRSASDLLRQAIQAANGDLQQSVGSESGGNSASCVLVLVTRGRSYVGHVGNARAYLVRNNAPNRLTRDHTTAQTWIDHGIMTEEQAKDRPEAHSLARALGEKSRVEPDVRSLPLNMERGDVLLLCSVGVHRYLEDDAMGSMVARLEPEHACHELCEVASGRSKNPDCKTLVYQSGPLRQGSYPRLLQQRRLRRQRKFVGFAAAVAALIAVAFGGFYIFGPTSGTPGGKATESTPEVRQELPLAAVADVVVDVAVPDSTSPPGPDAVMLQDVVAPAGDLVDLAVAPGDVVATGVDGVVADHMADSPVATEIVAAAVPDVVDVQPQLPIEPVVKPPPKSASAEPEWAAPPSKAALALCRGKNLVRSDRRRARDLRQLVRRGMEFLEGTKKDASAAARQARVAAKTLRNSSKAVRKQCGDHVLEFRNTVKARYLHLAWVSSTRAMDNLDQRTTHCAKSYRMARDAERLGATGEEIKEARRICWKE